MDGLRSFVIKDQKKKKITMITIKKISVEEAKKGVLTTELSILFKIPEATICAKL